MAIGIGFIGTGQIARLHAEALRRLGARTHIIGAHDIVKRAAEDFVAQVGGKTYPSVDELLADDEVDVVYICTRHDSHFDLVKRAVAARKAIFCEKPLSLNLDEAYAMERIVRKNGLPFAVGFNHRSTPGVIELCRQLGSLDSPTIIHISMATPAFLDGWAGLPEVGGGVFHCLGSHVFDLARYLIKSDPEEISAFGTRQRVSEDHLEDSAVAILRFPGGHLVSLNFHDQASYGYSVDPMGGLMRVEVFKGGKVAAGYTLDRMVFDVNGTICNYQVPEREQVVSWGYLVENRRFLAYLAGNKEEEWPAMIEDGLAAARMVAAAIRSNESRQIVNLREV